MTPLLPSDPAFDHFMARVPPVVAATLTEAQLVGLQQAYSNRHRQNHAVNMNVSLPLLGKRFYLVLLAGPERRSPQRLNTSRQASLATQLNVALVSAGLSLVLIVFGQVLGSFLTANPATASSSTQPLEAMLP